MELYSESGEENNCTPEYHEEYTAEEIEANYRRKVLTESYEDDVPVHLLIEKKRTQKMTRLNTKTMKKVCPFYLPIEKKRTKKMARLNMKTKC